MVRTTGLLLAIAGTVLMLSRPNDHSRRWIDAISPYFRVVATETRWTGVADRLERSARFRLWNARLALLQQTGLIRHGAIDAFGGALLAAVTAGTVGIACGLDGVVVPIAVVASFCVAASVWILTVSLRWSRLSDALQHELVHLVENLALHVASGRSAASAITKASKVTAMTWSPLLRGVEEDIARGLPPSSSLDALAQTVSMREFTRVAQLLGRHTYSPELSNLLRDELGTLRRESRLRLLKVLEKRSQIVWIPVTVAILVPGSILLTIPLLQMMKTFAQL